MEQNTDQKVHKGSYFYFFFWVACRIGSGLF